jgi:hypothetical protein
MSGAEAILDHVTIFAVWRALGGGVLRRGRGRAFWRDGDGWSVALSDAKGTWFDHRDGIGGGLLDLVVRARGGNRADALRWLAESFGLPLQSRPLTATERMRYARVAQEAGPLARAALAWHGARLSELEDQAREASERPDWAALASVAPELRRMRALSAEGTVREYLREREADPDGAAALVRIGRAWEAACRAVVEAAVEAWGAEDAAA